MFHYFLMILLWFLAVSQWKAPFLIGFSSDLIEAIPMNSLPGLVQHRWEWRRRDAVAWRRGEILQLMVNIPWFIGLKSHPLQLQTPSETVFGVVFWGLFTPQRVWLEHSGSFWWFIGFRNPPYLWWLKQHKEGFNLTRIGDAPLFSQFDPRWG